MTQQLLTVPAEAEGERLDRYLTGEIPNISRSQIQRLIDEGAVAVDRVKHTKANVQLREGDRITVNLPEPAAAADRDRRSAAATRHSGAGPSRCRAAGEHRTHLPAGLHHLLGRLHIAMRAMPFARI